VHAEVADVSQFDAEISDFLAADGGAICQKHKTVADTFFRHHAAKLSAQLPAQQPSYKLRRSYLVKRET